MKPSILIRILQFVLSGNGSRGHRRVRGVNPFQQPRTKAVPVSVPVSVSLALESNGSAAEPSAAPSLREESLREMQQPSMNAPALGSDVLEARTGRVVSGRRFRVGFDAIAGGAAEVFADRETETLAGAGELSRPQGRAGILPTALNRLSPKEDFQPAVSATVRPPVPPPVPNRKNDLRHQHAQAVQPAQAGLNRAPRPSMAAQDPQRTRQGFPPTSVPASPSGATARGNAGGGKTSDQTPTPSRSVRRPRRRWWKWWVKPAALKTPQQMELMLNTVQPVRNSLLDEDVEMVRRPKSRVIYETKPDAAVTQARLEEESDRTWERLRGRRMTSMTMQVDR